MNTVTVKRSELLERLTFSPIDYETFAPVKSVQIFVCVSSGSEY